MAPSRIRCTSGFSLLELTIVTALLAVIGAAFTRSMVSLRDLTRVTDVRAQLASEGEKAIAAIRADLRRSGFVDGGGVVYPYLFEDGVPDPGLSIHAHPAAAKEAQAGDPDFGPNREVVFLLPLDADSDGRPDVDGAGRLLWEAAEYAFVVVTRADGVNVLERRRDGVVLGTVADHVERVVFDDSLSSGFEIPLGTIRARVFFRQRDEKGTLHRHSVEVLFRLRNNP